MRDFAIYEKLEHVSASPKSGLHDALFGPQPAARVHPGGCRTAPRSASPCGTSTFGTFSGRYAICSSRTSTSSRPTAAAASAWRCSATWRTSRVARDCIDMEWNVLDWNTPAIEFYRRIGAKPMPAGSRSNSTGDALESTGRRSRQWLSETFDLVVVGGGPGGYVAAIRAAQLGMKTAVVEREHLGAYASTGAAFPTKALLRTSEINHLLHRLPDFGFAAVEPKFDIDKVVKRSRAVAKQLSQGVAHLLRKHKVTVFDGAGRLAGKQTLAVEKAGAAGHHAEVAAHRAGDRRAVPAAAGDRGGRKTDLDLQGGDGTARDAEVAAGDRLRRDRHRVRQLLSQHGRRGDGGGGAAAHPAGRGRGDFRLRAQGIREAGYPHPGRGDGEGCEEGRATT